MRKDCLTNKPAASGVNRAASNKPPTARTFNMTVQDALKDSDVIAGTLSLNSVSENALFDSGATKSFISRDFVHKLKLKAKPLKESLHVEIDNHEINYVNQIHPACDLGIGKNKVIFIGKRQTEKFLTPAQAKRILHKGNDAYLAYVVDTQREVPNLQDILIVNEFENLFLQDLPRLPPDRVIDFAIELAPKTTPISKVPYRLALLEMKELATQLAFEDSSRNAQEGIVEGVSIDPYKIDEVSNWERPTTPIEVRRFIGLAGYYRRFVQDFAKITAPLTRLTRKTEKFKWTEKCENSFQELKKRLVMVPVLALLDGKGDFVIYSDASHKGLGFEGTTYMERTARSSQNKRASSTFSRRKSLNMRQRRWLELIMDYDCEILFHPGKANVVDDALNMIMSSKELLRDFKKMEIEMKVIGVGNEKLFEIVMQPELLKKIRLCQKKVNNEGRETMTEDEISSEIDDKGIMRYFYRIWVPKVQELKDEILD
ncbi:hypothetical protein AgCh_031381 [Apium graveolens]